MASLVENVREKVKTAVAAATGQPATPGGYKGEELTAQQEKESQYRSESHIHKASIDLDHNFAIVLTGNNTVELKDIGPVKLNQDHEVIIRVSTSAICGSDLHMYRYRTNATSGTVLGHEITGEVIECGPAVKFIQKGDFVIVPFNVACGCCTNCKYIIVPHDDIRTPILERLAAKQSKKAMAGTESQTSFPTSGKQEYTPTGSEPLKPTHIAKTHGHPAGQEPKEAATTTEHMAHKKEAKPTKSATAAKNKATE